MILISWSFLFFFIQMSNAQSRELQFLFQSGLGIHHAGLSKPLNFGFIFLKARHDRHLMEKMFTEGAIRVMMCTATLAWGVNLPAYAVIIRVRNIFNFFFQKFLILREQKYSTHKRVFLLILEFSMFNKFLGEPEGRSTRTWVNLFKKIKIIINLKVMVL